MNIPTADIASLTKEKYGGDFTANMSADLARLEKGEPLAYVIGTQPFLGLTVHLDSHPLIPRPETEWWTEALIQHIQRDLQEPQRVLDLCAGSGAIGVSILKHIPTAHVSFGESEERHRTTIQKNITENVLDASRAEVRIGNLFEPFAGERFSIIATNPPYIPSDRVLPESVSSFEPSEALFAGERGTDVIAQILKEAPRHITSGGELWIECDTEHIEEVQQLAQIYGVLASQICNDLYGRPRLLIAYY